MAMSIVILVAALGLLTVGAELLVRGASALARAIGVSSLFIGLTVVGFGTSAPELGASITAAVRGLDDIAVGNVVGSNIFNIAVILGISALICPVPVRAMIVRKEVLIMIGVALVPYAGVLSGNAIPRWMGACMIALLIAYLWRGYYMGRRDDREHDGEAVDEGIAEPTGGRWLDRFAGRHTGQITLIVAGLVLLVFGSHLLVDSAVTIARTMGISDLMIGLTVVAAGTSMPELVTSMVAAVRRQSDIAVGNVVGSNIFNVLGILGVTCAITPQTLAPAVLRIDLPVMIVLSAACLPIILSGSRISRLEGGLLLAAFCAYMAALVLRSTGV